MIRRAFHSASLRHLARWAAPSLLLLLAFWMWHAARGALSAEAVASAARAVRAMPGTRIVAALLLTALSYLVLAGHDLLALRYAGCTGPRAVPLRRVGLASFVAYGLSHTLGTPAVSGSAVRLRYWTGWGVSTGDALRAATLAGLAFLCGTVLVTGGALLLLPAALLPAFGSPVAVVRSIGALLVAAAGLPAWWSVAAPSARLTLGLVAVVLADWATAAAVLFVLLRGPGDPGFAAFAGVFVLAQVVGVASHVPGGLGVFDGAMLLLLGPRLPHGELLGALAVYRACYYLLPFLVAAGLLAWHEGAAVRAAASRSLRATRRGCRAAYATSGAVGRMLARMSPSVVPRVASIVTFAAGTVLLVSGATPDLGGRVNALHAFVPLGVIEVSHLLASIAGAALLVLAWALHRRLDAAWSLATGLLAVAIPASLLKGLDWEEAVALALALAVLAPCRRAFHRKASLTAEPLQPGWLLAMIAVVGASVWLGWFSNRHVEYTTDLWWRFALRADAPRVLRASMAAAVSLVAFGILRLLRHAAVSPAHASVDDLSRARVAVSRSGQSGGHLALLGDNALLFDAAGAGFVQYAVEGRSWVALGDPVAPAGADGDRIRDALAWRLAEEADRNGGWPVFYEVPASSLPRYVAMGLSFLKMGESARVDVARFTLAGGHRRSLRRTVSALEEGGVSFEVIAPSAVAAILPELHRVSSEWLEGKQVREKQFSMGRWDDAYLCECPVAVVRAPVEGQAGPGPIVAFANLWSGAREELSVDLMRFATQAPSGTMDYLFVRLLQWADVEGYRWFDLGMAPLAGLDARPLGPLWAQAGAWLYRHGEHFYNFQGLRQYKDKFDPTWEPRYLASRGGIVRPRILANVATLVSGGLGGVVTR